MRIAMGYRISGNGRTFCLLKRISVDVRLLKHFIIGVGFLFLCQKMGML
ncbi:hypothetical protein [Prevotella sp. ne3005]|nr:hypothetical protein [Prevotella sp. ne3005]